MLEEELEIDFKKMSDSRPLDTLRSLDALPNIGIQENPSELFRQYEEEFEGFSPNYLTPKDTWDVVARYFKDFGLAEKQLASYNHFIDFTIPHLFATTPPIVVSCKNPKSSHKGETHKISFGSTYLSKPRNLFINLFLRNQV
jgi:hypothetical protein